MTDDNEFDDDLDFDEFDNFETLDINEMKANLPSYKIDKICQIIVCNRYFNFNKELTVFCMEELSNRRQAGDVFNYEEYIETQFNELPVLNFEMPDLRTMLNQAIGKK